MLSAELIGRLADEAGLASASFTLARLDREDAPRLARDPERYLYPASMLKTPLALVAYALVQDGELRVDDRFPVDQANMTTNDADSPLIPGYISPLSELIELMITRSDNVATNMLYDILGRERATRVAQERFGLRSTAFYRKLSGSLPLINDPGWDGVHRNTHSVADAARLFELIARDRVPFAFTLRQTLGRQAWNDKLSAGLERGDLFAHKTGGTDEVTHDGGILETRQGASYVLVVYTGAESTDENNAKFGPFMRSLRSYL